MDMRTREGRYVPGTLPSNQNGAALVVALVVLSVVTVIGISNMQSTTLEMRMAASLVDRTKAFTYVEAALKYAEQDLEGGGWLTAENLYSDCSLGSDCFDSVCTNGLCADVDYTSLSTRYDCVVSPNASSTDRVDYWKVQNLWSDADRHKVTPISAGMPIRVKYIYEFLCYIDTTSSTPTEGKPLFRITAYLEQGVEDEAAVSDDEDRSNAWRSRSPIMIQSTYPLPW